MKLTGNVTSDRIYKTRITLTLTYTHTHKHTLPDSPSTKNFHELLSNHDLSFPIYLQPSK